MRQAIQSRPPEPETGMGVMLFKIMRSKKAPTRQRPIPWMESAYKRRVRIIMVQLHAAKFSKQRRRPGNGLLFEMFNTLLPLAMSKHNNSTSPSSSRRCRCGRYITLGEEHAGIGVFGYTCPDCQYLENKGIYTIKQYNDYLRAIQK